MEIEELARLRRAETSRNTALAANAHDITKVEKDFSMLRSHAACFRFATGIW